MGGFVSQTALNFLFAGYAVIWVIIFGYVWFLGRKQGKLEDELARLERAVSAASGGAAAGGTR